MATEETKDMRFGIILNGGSRPELSRQQELTELLRCWQAGLSSAAQRSASLK
jgi:hypothetical protein